MQINNKLIDDFIARSDWNSVWMEDTFSQVDTEAIEKNLDYNKFDWMCGATKMVFQPRDPNAEYVIKIPFRFLGEDNYDYDEEDDTSSPYYYNEIMYAPLPKFGVYKYGFNQYDWDYCQTELQYYELAISAKISEFFPETIQYCEEPYPIYIQEACYPVYIKQDAMHDWKETSEKRETLTNYLQSKYAESISNWCYIFNPFWIQDAIDCYGESKITNLFQFMTTYQMKDFHSANYGYRKSDNTPVLIDFAGFYED